MAPKQLPSFDEHIKRAVENERLALWLAKDQAEGVDVDWAITIIFYSALHLIDSYLAVKHVHPSDHHERDTEVENNGSLSQIYSEYRRLKDLSRTARYTRANFDQSKFSSALRRLYMIKSHLASLANN